MAHFTTHAEKRATPSTNKSTKFIGKMKKR